MIIVGKFYLKSGVIVEEEIDIEKENVSIEKVVAGTEAIQRVVREAFDESDDDFCINYGHSIIRGKDVSAVTFKMYEEGKENG